MARAAIAAVIAQLDATSRERALTPAESRRLSLLITTERRYDYSRRAHAQAVEACR